MYPFISICTPTYNRRPFFEMTKRCFLHQTYPLDRMEWVIVDDGTDKIEDIVLEIKQVKYFPLESKITLGAKRNLMHQKASGEYIVYMDDDDYYPPDRVLHAIQVLMENPNIYCVGCSVLHTYFNDTKQMYRFGPYGDNHATAATMAFRKTMLSITSYDETSCLAEEKHFLKNYTIPIIQLDPLKTILVFSHSQNTFDKRILLEKPSDFVRLSTLSLDDFLDEKTKQFIVNDMETILEIYEPGKIKNKPDVLKQIDEMTASRKEREREHKKRHIEKLMSMNPLELANMYEKKIHETFTLLNETKRLLETEKEKNKYLTNKITEIIQKSIRDNKSL